MCGSSEQSLKEPLHRIPARYIWTMPITSDEGSLCNHCSGQMEGGTERRDS